MHSVHYSIRNSVTLKQFPQVKPQQTLEITPQISRSNTQMEKPAMPSCTYKIQSMLSL